MAERKPLKKEAPVAPKPGGDKWQRFTWIGIGALAILYVVNAIILAQVQPREIPYSEMIALIRDDKVQKVELRENEIVAVPHENLDAAEDKAAGQKDPEKRIETLSASRIPGIEEKALMDLLTEKEIPYQGKIEEQAWWKPVLFGWILPIGLLILFYSYLMRRMGGAGGSGPLSFGKSKAKIHDRSLTDQVTFNDVAGVDEAEAELVEVVDFLRHPEKYRALGAKIPKGVLLVGPPGTGKTLLAKAVAGEAKVPFFTLSGSDFVEMFVGVGAARVRDLFAQAKERAPCIVFIDELDAIGKSRGGIGAMATHDEREQTLNQLLAEMDGFDPTKGVILMAATNRPEILDPALLRAGRFDRQVLVDRPDVAGRHAILKIHARQLQMESGVDLKVVAQRTPGMAGADLANIVNEAALASARRGGKEVETRDFEEAVDRIQLGLKKKNRVMTPEVKRRVAYHEAGHALVALSVENADPVHRVTIIPRSIGALGATLQLPTEEKYLLTKSELTDRICVMLGGRVAESEVFGEISTGAENDLERATETARQMVTRFGMSDVLGGQTYGRSHRMAFLDSPLATTEEKTYSEATAQKIDAEIRAVMKGAEERAAQILQQKRSVLDAIAERLLELETIDAETLGSLISKNQT
jgi:cell division protease FtsH